MPQLAVCVNSKMPFSIPVTILYQLTVQLEVIFINSNGLVRLMGQGSHKVLEQVAVSQWPSRVAS